MGSVATAGVWLWCFAAPAATWKGAALAAAFLAYSAVLYLIVWRRPWKRRLAYFTVLPADLLVLFFLCLWSVEPMSGVYLAFYVVVAVHALVFGFSVGLAAAGGFAALYAVLRAATPTAEPLSPQEFLLRIGFAFLIALAIALLSRELRAGRERLAAANRELEQRNRSLEQTYRHLSVGRLAGDVAHNINNPAAVILARAHLLRRRVESDGLPRSYLDDLAVISSHTLRIANVVRSLLALAGDAEGPLATIDLGQATESVVSLFERHASLKGVRIERRLRPNVTVLGQQAALREVVANLLGNALDALDGVSEGGEVIIETDLGAAPHTAELRVRDNGHGVAVEHLDQIFSPFFTTKKGAQGIGLGLSRSLAIVRRLDGTIAVESTAGRGSVFTVTLATEAAPEGRETAA